MRRLSLWNLLAVVSLAVAAAAPAQAAPAATPVAQASGSITVWHAWTGAEEQTLKTAVAAFEAVNPGATVKLLAVPFDQLQNKYTIEASTGGGPDILVGPKDWIGVLAQANLILPVDDIASDTLATLNPAAVQANQYQGRVWAIPESTEAVGIYYNKDLVPTPPTDTDAMLQTAATSGLAINSLFYHFSGFIFAFGGQLFDADQRVILDQGGTADALGWLKTAKDMPGVTVDNDTSKLDALFKDGKVGMIVNGPWAAGDYAKVLGKDKLGIMPPVTISQTGWTFAPFLGTKNFFISANVQNQPLVLAFVSYVVSPEVQSTFASEAGHIPSNVLADVQDPIVSGFVAQTQSATYFPNEPEMGAVWTPAGDMITKVIEGKAAPDSAVREATDTINRANKKF